MLYAIKRQRRYLVGLWMVVCTTSAAWGADLGSGPLSTVPAGPPAPRWTLSFTPYGWLSGLNGDTTVKARTTDVDVGPFKVLDHLDGAPWMSYAEARNGRLSFYNDIVYAPLAVDGSGVRTRGPISLEAALGVEIEQTVVEAGATYEVGSGIRSADLPPSMSWLARAIGVRMSRSVSPFRLRSMSPG